MKNILYLISAFLILIFWPLSIIISNTESWFIYVFPALVVFVDYLLFKKNVSFHHLVLLVIPFTILLTSPKAFYTYSIFTPDPLKFDTLIKKINLIPNRSLSRVFENKLTVPMEKFTGNSFVFFDLNNYFFSLHPRELVRENQNLQKYSFLTIIFFLYGLFLLPKNTNIWWILNIAAISIFCLSLINNPDKYDFVLYLPISLIALNGLKQFSNNYSKLSFLCLPCFILISSIELIRIVILR